MENANGKTLADFTPDVASDAVVEIQMRGGGNRHAIAERLARQHAPAELLKPASARAKRAVEVAEAARAKAVAELDAVGEAERDVANRTAQREAKRQQVLGTERALQLAENDIAGFANDLAGFNLATSTGLNAALERANSVNIAERLATVLPSTLAKLRAELAAQEAELATLRQKLEA